MSRKTDGPFMKSSNVLYPFHYRNSSHALTSSSLTTVPRSGLDRDRVRTPQSQRIDGWTSGTLQTPFKRLGDYIGYNHFQRCVHAHIKGFVTMVSIMSHALTLKGDGWWIEVLRQSLAQEDSGTFRDFRFRRIVSGGVEDEFEGVAAFIT